MAKSTTSTSKNTVHLTLTPSSTSSLSITRPSKPLRTPSSSSTRRTNPNEHLLAKLFFSTPSSTFVGRGTPARADPFLSAGDLRKESRHRPKIDQVYERDFKNLGGF
ncbi:hypothetical protein ACMFMG_009623 [Clarireedia jacksonii]